MCYMHLHCIFEIIIMVSFFIMTVFTHMQNWAARWPCFDLLYTAKFNNNNDNGIRTSLEILDVRKHLVHVY